MKKFIYICVTALFATLSLSLASCNSDDDEEYSSKDLVGTWVADIDDEQYITLRFWKGHDFNMTIETYYDDEDEYGTWELEGDVLTLFYEDGGSEELTITKLTKKQLHLKGGRQTIEFIKVSSDPEYDY